jgi:hypothetical protein
MSLVRRALRRILPATAIVVLLALATGAALAAQPTADRGGGPGLPSPLPGWLFGPNLVRANAVVVSGPVTRLYRLDRGKVKSVSTTLVTLREKDSVVQIPIASSTKVRMNARPGTPLSLRRGMAAIVVREGDAPAELVVASARSLQTAWLATSYFGPNMARVEAYVQASGVPHDYRVDRGQVKAYDETTLTLRERDGLLVVVPLSPAVRVKLNGRTAPLSALRRGMPAAAVRDGDAAADTVLASDQ